MPVTICKAILQGNLQQKVLRHSAACSQVLCLTVTDRLITVLEHTCNSLLQAAHPGDSTRVRGCIFVQGGAVLCLPECVCYLFKVLAITAHQIKVLALKVSGNDSAIQQALKAVQQLEDGSNCGAVIKCLQSIKKMSSKHMSQKADSS